MSKLFDKLKNAARSRGNPDSSAPNALLSHALRRAAAERRALRAASPAGTQKAIDVEVVEVVEAATVQSEAEAQERLALAARERAEAELLALETARLRVEAEERATLLAKEREETERSAAREALERAEAEREAAEQARRSEAAEAERLAAVKAREVAEERAAQLAREREELERKAAREAQERAQAERDAARALEDRLRLENEAAESEETEEVDNRGIKRGLLVTLFALAIVGAAIVTRSFMPGGMFGEHTAPLYKLERELKTAPDTFRK